MELGARLITHSNTLYVNFINPHRALGFNVMAEHHMRDALLNDITLSDLIQGRVLTSGIFQS